VGSNSRHRQRREARGPASLSPKRRLLVACEGKVTEPTYILGFTRKTRNATVVVRIHPEHGDPRKLVEMAKSARAQARARASQQNDDFLAYDEVWCAFDRDQHERFEDACQMARDNQLERSRSPIRASSSGYSCTSARVQARSIGVTCKRCSRRFCPTTTSTWTSSSSPTESTRRPGVRAASTSRPSAWASHSSIPPPVSTD
jgi:RloB-like protein